MAYELGLHRALVGWPEELHVAAEEVARHHASEAMTRLLWVARAPRPAPAQDSLPVGKIAAGVAPAAASAAVHFSEIGTTLVSGFSHHKLGNVDWRTVSILAVPGFVDVHVLVPGSMSVQEGHDLAEGIGELLVRAIKELAPLLPKIVAAFENIAKVMVKRLHHTGSTLRSIARELLTKLNALLVIAWRSDNREHARPFGYPVPSSQE